MRRLGDLLIGAFIGLAICVGTGLATMGAFFLMVAWAGAQCP